MKHKPVSYTHLAIIPDLAIGNIIEPVDEVGNGGLTGTGGAYKGDLLTGFRIEADVMQDNLVRGVAEVYIVEPYLTLELYIIEAIVLLVGNLPGDVYKRQP